MSHKDKLSLLDFRRIITRSYLQLSSASAPKNAGRPKRLHSHTLNDVRYSSDGHTIERTLNGKQRRCGVCKKKVSKQCVKCDVGIHMGNCFIDWHSK